MKPDLKIVVSNQAPQPAAAESVPEQVEMPFAIVHGEPITQLPRDLYIPPQALEVFLEAFEGPLDLLLYLIRKQNIDVLDIPIAEITRQYMSYIELMQELHLELAGEYMVMAATLAEIKSRMLLPRAHTEGQQQEEDPRAELVRRLQEYERFKQAAENLDSLPRLERDVWSTSAEVTEKRVVRALPQVTLQEMLMAFKDVVIRAEMFAHHHIEKERLSVRARMTDILSALEHASFINFVHLFKPEEGRMGVTVTFVAILELVREGLIEIVQAEPFAPLHVRAAGPRRGLRLVTDNTSVAEEAQADADNAQSSEEVVAPEELAAMMDDAFEDDDEDDEELYSDELDKVFPADAPVADASAEDVRPADAAVEDDSSLGSDEVSALEEQALVADDAASAEELAPVADEAFSADEQAPVVDDASSAEELAPVADEAPSAEELAPVLDEASSTEELVSVADEASSAEELAPVVDEASSAEGQAAVADEVSGSEELAPAVGEASGAEELGPVADEASSSGESPAVVDEASSAEEPPAKDRAGNADEVSS